MPIVSVTLGDAYGRTTSKRFEIATQADLAAYSASAAALITDLEAVMDLGVRRVDLLIEIPGQESDPVALSNVDRGATFSGYLTSGNGKKGSLKLPGITLSLVNSDGSVPLTGAIATYLGNFEAAGDYLISDGETVDSWIAGVLDK